MISGELTAGLILKDIDRLATEITLTQQPGREGVSQQHGMDFGKHSANVRDELIELSEAVRSGVPELFGAKIAWLKQTLSARGVPSYYISMNLDTEESVLGKHLSPEAMAQVSSVIETGRRELDLDITEKDNSFFEPTIRGELAEKFLKTLLTGDRTSAGSMIFDAVDNGLSIRDTYLDIFQPCLFQVGAMWHQGRITVAHEHFVSAAIQLIMSELYPRIRRQSELMRKDTVIVGCVAGELHEIGSRMVADLLELAGWRVLYLGANTPGTSLVDIAREQGAVLLALSMALPSSGPATREILERVRREIGGRNQGFTQWLHFQPFPRVCRVFSG